jgi:hypothetical protein
VIGLSPTIKGSDQLKETDSNPVGDPVKDSGGPGRPDASDRLFDPLGEEDTVIPDLRILFIDIFRKSPKQMLKM